MHITCSSTRTTLCTICNLSNCVNEIVFFFKFKAWEIFSNMTKNILKLKWCLVYNKTLFTWTSEAWKYLFPQTWSNVTAKSLKVILYYFLNLKPLSLKPYMPSLCIYYGTYYNVCSNSRKKVTTGNCMALNLLYPDMFVV